MRRRDPGKRPPPRILARGDRREPIFVDDHDRHRFLDVVAQALSRFDAEILAYCLMGNHGARPLGLPRRSFDRAGGASVWGQALPFSFSRSPDQQVYKGDGV